MGMTRWQVLTKIELPLAVPVILAGVRTALVINVWHCDPRGVHRRWRSRRDDQLGSQAQSEPHADHGSAITALLALTIDWLSLWRKESFDLEGCSCLLTQPAAGRPI